MNWLFKLRNLPKDLKVLVVLFLVTMLFSYGTSFILVLDQTGISPSGIEENYNGLEDNDEAETIYFKKSKFAMLTSIHSHVFTLGLIFLVTGLMVYFTGLPQKVKIFLMAEPLISLMVTFSSHILLSQGHLIFKYLAYLSGALMHGVFVMMLLLLLRELYFVRTSSSNS